MRPLRVLLADDHRLIRAGIRALLEQLGNVEVVAEAANGREALELADKHRPDIVLMDIAMPELNGLEATERLKKQFPRMRVLLLSMHADEAYVSQALAAGADGYILKNAGVVELELAIQAAARGESYLSPAVASDLGQGRAPHGEGWVAAADPTPARNPSGNCRGIIDEGNRRQARIERQDRRDAPREVNGALGHP